MKVEVNKLSLVSILKVKKWYGQKNTLSIICADSRVSDEFSKGNRMIRTKFDEAEKIICISPNIIMGIAGDYSVIELIKELKDYLNEDQKYMQYIGFIRKDIQNFFVSRTMSNTRNADILMILKDYKSNISRIYKYCLPEHIFVEIDSKEDYTISSIGSSAEVRAEVKKNFENDDLRNIFIYNGNSNVDSPITITNMFIMSNIYASSGDNSVGGYFNAYYMDELGWHNIGIARSDDQGEHFIASALSKEGIEVQVNGKKHIVLNSGSTYVDNELKRRGAK